MKKFMFIPVICAIIAFSCTFDSHVIGFESISFHRRVSELKRTLAETEKQLAEIFKRMEEEGITETEEKRLVLDIAIKKDTN